MFPFISYTSASADVAPALATGRIDCDELLDFKCSALVRSREPLEPLEPREPSDASEMTLRMLRKRASGPADVKSVQIEGRLIATRLMPISNVM